MVCFAKVRLLDAHADAALPGVPHARPEYDARVHLEAYAFTYLAVSDDDTVELAYRHDILQQCCAFERVCLCMLRRSWLASCS